MAAVAGDGDCFLGGMDDCRLKPRLLRALLRDCLPLPQAEAEAPSPADLASALEAVRTHGLLSECLPVRPDPALAEAWRAAVDAWVERLLALVSRDRAHNCWVGISFLGLTFQECSDDRFAESCSDWFEKVLRNLKAPSSTKMVNMVSCSSMADLFVRLANFSKLKDEATSYAGKVVQPVLHLLDENGPVAEKAIDLLGTVIKLFPSSISRYYVKVESAIAAKVLCSEFSLQQSTKFASSLALLPRVRVAKGGLSLMIRKILIVVNNLLNDAFLGLEEEKSGYEIMMLLVPPGSDPPPPLGGHTTPGELVDATKKFHISTVPTISAFMHCCSLMLTSSDSIQANIPVCTLIALVRRVLLVDGSLRKSLPPSTTSLEQELICFELPTLHLSFLDLLVAAIKGMGRQLLPHASSIILLITEYFNRAKMPAIRTKVYNIMQLLLTSMGVGMSLYLLQAVVSNAIADLDGSCGSNFFLFTTYPSKATNESSMKSYSRKRKQALQMQNSTVLGSKKAVVGSKKWKNSTMTYASKGRTSEPTAVSRKLMTPLSVKIAALETLEILLNVGGSLLAYCWRTGVDLLLANVARNACDRGGGYEQRSSSTEEPSMLDFQLASLKALLASFLSPSHVRPPYLAQGLELFSRGKLATDTKLAEFCSHALLTLDVLMNPRAFPLERTAHGGLGLNYGASEKVLFDTGKSKCPLSGGDPQATDDSDDEELLNDWLVLGDEPTDILVKDGAVGKHLPVELSRDSEAQQDGQKLVEDTIIQDHPEIISSQVPVPETGQDVSKSSKTNIEMAMAGTKEKDELDKNTLELNTLCNSSSSTNVASALISTTLPDSWAPIVATVSEEMHMDLHSDVQNKSLAVNMSYAGLTSLDEGQIVSDGGASSSQQAPEHTSSFFASPSIAKLFCSDSESIDSLLDIFDFDPDL